MISWVRCRIKRSRLQGGLSLIDLGEHRLRDLSQPQRLYQVQAEGLKKEFPPLKSLNFTLGNLPTPATSFLGREKDLAEITALLRTLRLLTLTGVSCWICS